MTADSDPAIAREPIPEKLEYVGGGYFRDASVPVGEKARIVHGPELLEEFNRLRALLSPPAEAQEIERLRAENERLREALEWRPIETAPKDGTLIIVTNGAQRYPVRWWWPIGWSDNGRHDLLWTPTHWMPLPDPPSTPEPRNGE